MAARATGCGSGTGSGSGSGSVWQKAVSVWWYVLCRCCNAMSSDSAIGRSDHAIRYEWADCDRPGVTVTRVARLAALVFAVSASASSPNSRALEDEHLVHCSGAHSSSAAADRLAPLRCAHVGRASPAERECASGQMCSGRAQCLLRANRASRGHVHSSTYTCRRRASMLSSPSVAVSAACPPPRPLCGQCGRPVAARRPATRAAAPVH